MKNIGNVCEKVEKGQTFSEDLASEVLNSVKTYRGIGKTLGQLDTPSLGPKVCPSHEDSFEDYDSDQFKTIYVGGDELIPEGFYIAECVKLGIEYFGTMRKLVKFFRICDGPHKGIVLKEYCNFPYETKRSSKLTREWRIANNGNKPTRNDRMPMKVFIGKTFKVTVKTCKSKDDGEDYSIVEKICSLV